MEESIQSTLSDYCLEYIQDKRLTNCPWILLLFNSQGQLSSHRINILESIKQLGIINLTPGQTLESICPYLNNEYVTSPHNTIIQNIEYTPGIVLNIHIITGQFSGHGLLLEDNTQQAVSLQKKIQEKNEMTLNQSLPSKKKDIGLRILSSLNIGVLEHIDTNNFALINTPPAWIINLLTQKGYQKNAINIIDHFSYLESFVPQAIEFWQSCHEGKMDSQLWIEVDSLGKEHYLQAYAIKIDDKNLMVIGPSDIYVDEKQVLIQKARENSLIEEKLVKERISLKKLLELKDQFVSIVSHDLRAPASNALSYFNFLFEEEDFISRITEKQKRFLDVIYNELNNFLRYNEKVYQWMNLELGQMKIELEAVDLSEMGLFILKTFSSKAEAKAIKLITNVQNDILVEVDISLFRNVLTNLISNAIKFTPEGGSVELNIRKTDDQIVLKVIDSGVGINKKFVGEIFGNYNAKHTVGTEGERGTGLGLGICKKIIDGHRFEIDFNSEPNQGSEFIITIR